MSRHNTPLSHLASGLSHCHVSGEDWQHCHVSWTFEAVCRSSCGTSLYQWQEELKIALGVEEMPKISWSNWNAVWKLWHSKSRLHFGRRDYECGPPSKRPRGAGPMSQTLTGAVCDAEENGCGNQNEVSSYANLKAQNSSCGSKKYPITTLSTMVSLQAACNVSLRFSS